MPTYKNVLDKPVVIESGFVVESKAKIELPNYLDSGLLKFVSDKPYYNPNAYNHEMTSDSITLSIDLKNWNDIEGIEIWNNSGSDIIVYLQSRENQPGIRIFSKSIRRIYGFHSSVKTLHFNFMGPVLENECHITEIKNRSLIETERI
jgi:hypothetical protein